MYPRLNEMFTTSYNNNNDNVIIDYPSLPAYIPLNDQKRLISGLKITILARTFPYDFFNDIIQIFRIDFLDCFNVNNSNKIIFHFNPRIDGNNRNGFIVMNTFNYNQWEQEIRSNCYDERFPFYSDQQFMLTIEIEIDKFIIKVNDNLLCTFNHRYNIYDANHLHIDGKIHIDRIKFERTYNNNNNNHISQPFNIITPTIPFFYHLPEIGKQSYDIILIGNMHDIVSEYFGINFACSENGRYRCESEFDNIPIHISIRTEHSEIVRNTMTNKNWGYEEKDLMIPFEFYSRKQFLIKLSIRHYSLEAIIDGRFAFGYRHRLSWQSIDSLQIYGSVDLSEIKLEPVYY